MVQRTSSLVVVAVVATVAMACGRNGGRAEPAGSTGAGPPRSGAATRIVVPEQVGELGLSAPRLVAEHGALNPTTAFDPDSGRLYVAWAREVAGAVTGERDDPLLEAVVAWSTDRGATLSEPVVVSDAPVYTRTVSPTQVAVGPGGAVYVLYQRAVPFELSGDRGRRSLHVARSTDGGATFSAPVMVAAEDTEGVVTSMDMATLFVARDGDVYISFLDARETIEARRNGLDPDDSGHGGHGDRDTPGPENQLRVVRSGDGGRTWSRSTLVARASCVCCGTMIAGGAGVPLYAGTRSEWKELKDSQDAVRDPYLSISPDEGATWGEPFKIHDDRFKVSGCPDVSSGLAVDSGGRVHAAWYTGTEAHPGVYYAASADGGRTFSRPVELLGGDWIPYGDVKLALDGEDHAWVAFEDRRGDVDQIRVVRIDPQGAVAFSSTWPGTIPSITAGDEWAAVVWQGVDEPGGHEEAPTAVSIRIARPPT